LLQLLDQLDASLQQFNQAVQEQAAQHEAALRLMTHPGVGPVTSLAFVLMIGPVTRFARSKQLVSYLGLNPREHSSGGRQKLGSISKQGNPLLRGFWSKPDTRRRGWTVSYATTINGSSCGVAAAWPRSRSPGNWRSGCTGCCAAR
jgi:transposase